jgi:hypothetical protein
MARLSPHPIYLPFLSRAEDQRAPAFIQMGLSAVEAVQWLDVDNNFARYFENKSALLSEKPNRVWAAEPESQWAQLELSELLLHNLSEYHPAHTEYLRAAGLLDHTSPPDMRSLSLCVQEDLCLLQYSEGQHRLTAASLCAPSDWSLQEKIGRPLSAIHQTVPGLNVELEQRIEQFLVYLKPNRPIERFNWSIKSCDHLALFADTAVESSEANVNVGLQDLTLRVERQVFNRLPRSEAVAFTIRVYLTPLSQLMADADLAAALRNAISDMTIEQLSYKSMLDIAKVVL